LQSSFTVGYTAVSVSKHGSCAPGVPQAGRKLVATTTPVVAAGVKLAQELGSRSSRVVHWPSPGGAPKMHVGTLGVQTSRKYLTARIWPFAAGSSS